MRKAANGNGTATMRSTNFVTILAILNAIVERFNDDAVKGHLATLGQPFAAGIEVNGALTGGVKSK